MNLVEYLNEIVPFCMYLYRKKKAAEMFPGIFPNLKKI